MRAADLSWEPPPSPFKTSISSTAIIALQLRRKRHSVPPKELNVCLNHVRGCLPQSLHSPQFSEPDPIYPYLPFLFCLCTWQRLCQYIASELYFSSRYFLEKKVRLYVNEHTSTPRARICSIQNSAYV